MAGEIEQFMWQWQPHFRIAVQGLAERSLETAGAFLDPQVTVIGFAVEPASARFPVCIEPETGALNLTHLAGVAGRTEEIYAADPECRIVNSDRATDEARHRWLKRRSRATAIGEAIEASGAMPGRRLLVSSAGLVDGYEVHTCLAVDRELFDSLPRLEGEDVNRYPAPSSFVGHLVDFVLAEADVALSARDPGWDSIRRNPDDLVARAADGFVMGCSFRSRNFIQPAVCRWLDAIAKRAYEGTSVVGRLLFVDPKSDNLEVAARFRHPVSMANDRAVRKLLEMCADDLALLVHGDGVYGLGRIVGPAGPAVFEVAFVSHATWELGSEDVVHLRSSYRQPCLPKPAFDTSVLSDTLARALGGDADIEVLTSLVEAAALARHGTTLVVSVDAAAEAIRLSGQSTVIEPMPLTPDVLSHVAQIDGAVLVDHAGICHAVGVILDGTAAAEGDPSRGARYNSAIKYVDSAPAAAVVIAVSEDGDVTQIPELRPRLRRQEVTDALTVLEAGAKSDQRQAFHAALASLRPLAFYLSAKQCARANELIQQEHDQVVRSGAISIVSPRFAPDPTMDDSYFVD